MPRASSCFRLTKRLKPTPSCQSSTPSGFFVSDPKSQVGYSGASFGQIKAQRPHANSNTTVTLPETTMCRQHGGGVYFDRRVRSEDARSCA